MTTQRPLIIGPLPPPNGGARVSYGAYHRYLVEREEAFVHRDLPHHRYRTPRFRHLRNLLSFLECIVRVPLATRLIIFCSPHFGFVFGGLLVTWARLWGKPTALRFFGGHPFQGMKAYPALVRALLLWMLGRADRIVVQTQTGYNEFPRKLHPRLRVIWGYRKIRPPVPVDRSHDPVVRFICPSAMPVKGIGVLRRALALLDAQHPNAYHVHIYGAPPEGDADVAALQTLETVTFYGMVPNKQFVAALPGYDVFLFPSIYRNEGHPGALIEALAAGLAVLMSDLSGPAEVAEPNKHALVVPAGDAQALASGMARLIADPALRQSLSQAAAVQGQNFDEQILLPKLHEALGLSG